MSVSAKILLIMADVGMLSKDKQLTGGGSYMYLSEEKVTAELHKACVEHKLTVCPVNMVLLESREDTTAKGNALHVARISATYRVTDPEDGDSIEIAALGEGSDSGDKVLNKCMTAAYKYAMRQTFMISTGDDPDHKASEETALPAAQPAAQATRQATPPPAAQSNASGATPNDVKTARALWFKALEFAGLLEPDPKPNYPDQMKPSGGWYGISDKAGLPRSWSRYTPAEYAQAVAAVKAHVARHADDQGDYPPNDMEDPFADQ